MSLYDELNNFGSLIYTVGDGCPPNKYGVNALSRNNAEAAANLALQNSDSLLFIAGGNGGEQGKRGSGIPGSDQEAQRMVRYIRECVSSTIPIISDCDPKFQERFGLDASMNTIQNGRNAAAIIEAGALNDVDIVAERLHLLRVIGTFRRQLERLNLLDDINMRAHPVNSEFEATNDQFHITSIDAFRAWNRKANVHHLLTGNVPRVEFLQELLTGRNYRHLYAEQQS